MIGKAIIDCSKATIFLEPYENTKKKQVTWFIVYVNGKQQEETSNNDNN